VRFLFFFIFLLLGLSLQAQRFTVNVSSLRARSPGFAQTNWLHHRGDHPNGADPKLNDSSWTTINPALPLDSVPVEDFGGLAWFRLWVNVDSTQVNKPLCLVLEHEGASEIYLNGVRLFDFGTVSADPEKEVRELPGGRPVAFSVPHKGPHLIAVRYSNHQAMTSYDDKGMRTAGFRVEVRDYEEYLHEYVVVTKVYLTILAALGCMFFVFALMHLMLYIAYRAKRSNLYFFLFALSFSLILISLMVNNLSDSPDVAGYGDLGKVLFMPFLFFTLHLLVYSLFREKLPRILWISAGGTVLVAVLLFVHGELAFITFMLGLAPFVSVDVIRNVIIAIRQKKEGAWIVGTGMTLFAVFLITLVVILIVGMVAGGVNIGADSPLGVIILVLFTLGVISIPLSMSFYLARDFSRTNRQLEQKLSEVGELSAKNIEQEKEKQRILSSQNEMLEQQVLERTAEIVEQKKIIEEKNKDITDSISYARRIQQALLPTPAHIAALFPEAFVLNQPKDIVSGDFFWFGEKNGLRFAVLADCTGHGVPGALMSMIGHNLLDQIILERGVADPGAILSALHEGVSQALKQKQDNSETRDGMDVALLCYDPAKKEMRFAGANRPLWIIDGSGALHELKGDKRSIGGLQTEEARSFSTQPVPLSGAVMIYLSSDGYADQFGGSEGKKFMTKRFKELLCSLHMLPAGEQRTRLEKAIGDWRGNREQVDDICVIGIRL